MNFDIIEVKENILKDNDSAAKEVRALLNENKVFFINMMGSPGSGKTTTLLRLIEALKDDYRIGVIEADVDDCVDALTIEKTGVKVLQAHTAGLCHMDADMSRRCLLKLGIEDLDLVILENIGNLVCPAEFDVGADLRVMILSVPEGDDKPLKYPLMFTVSDVMLMNKIDTREVFDFDEELAVERAKKLNPDIRAFPVSSLNNEGLDDFIEYLKERIDKYGNENN